RTMQINARIIVALLMLAVAVMLPTHRTSAASDEAAAGQELQQMQLTTADLGLAGMSNYQVDRASGQPCTPSDLAFEAVSDGFTTVAGAEAVLYAGGVTEGYRQVYRLKYPNDPVSAVDTAREVTVTLLAYADADSAAAAFEPVAELYG